MPNINNWENKEERAKKAKTHTAEMTKKYKEQIAGSIENSTIYSLIIPEAENSKTKIIVEDIDSVGAVFKYVSDKTTAVLNFASYKHPGGMFLNGSRAQEECLCHESTLYNVLSANQFEKFYEQNKKTLNRSLYTDRAIYSKDIVFEREGKEVYCDVITCAAPNRSAAKKYGLVSEEENLRTLENRISFVMNIAKTQNVKTLILGAFGCGVFGQDPDVVAKCFKNWINENKHDFDMIVFAVPKLTNPENYNAFRKVFLNF